MIVPSRRTGSRAGAAAAAATQAALGLGAHAVAAGCLPAGSALVLAAPSAVLAVLLAGRLLPGSRLLQLGGGQLAVHAVLAALAACGGGHAHGHGGSTRMLLAHVAALVLCRAALDELVRRVQTAAATTRAVLRPVLRVPVLRLPALLAPAAPNPAAPLRSYDVLPTAPRRGPPVGALLPA